MRLLLFNLATDEADPVLGFACRWIRRLAAECEQVDVLTMFEGSHSLPANTRVFSAGRERGLSKPLRAANFYRHLLRLLAMRNYDACFAHMTPLFAGMAGPLLTARGIRTALWYTHRQRSFQLKLGLRMCWRAVSADGSSFPYRTDKLRVIGHGIDTAFYSPAPAGSLQEAGGNQALVVQVGRLAPIKHQATTVAAVAETGARLALIGGVQAGASSDYEATLADIARRAGMAERCEFTGDLPAAAVRDWYRRATAAVNMSPAGLFDKAALESMACGVPTIVCNPAFTPLLGKDVDLLLTAGPDDSRGLRERLERLFALPARERAQIGRELRRRVEREHSLDGLVGRLLAILRTGEAPGHQPPLP